MAKLNSLLYSIIFSSILFTSANAEWVMQSDNQHLYMYNSETGEVFVQVVDDNNAPAMMNVPFASGKLRFKNPKQLINSIYKSPKPQSED